MSIVDQKRDVFGKIAAVRTSCEGFPDLSLNSSLPSINNSTDSIAFLTDLLKSLVGFEKLKAMLTDILVFEVDTIEEEIKRALKKALKDLVSCSVDPSIPQFLKHQTIEPTATGYDVDLVKLDYLGILYVDPSSTEGKYYYDDSLGLNSKDYNSFLYESVQLSSQEDWGAQTLSDDIFSVQFTEQGGPTNNNLNMRASAYYSNPSNNKTLTDLNNDYIDSINILNPQRVISQVIDAIFGAISVDIGKSQSQLEIEARVKYIMECIINADESTVVDDSFFTFDNETIQDIESNVNQRRKGIKVVTTCGNLETSVDSDILSRAIDDVITATTTGNKVEIKSTVDASINDIALNTSEATDEEKDKYNLQLNLIDNMIKELTNAIVSIILSPKIMSIFLVNHRIVYGPNATFNGPEDFMRQNKGLIKEITRAVRNAIIRVLLREALKEIKELAACHAVKLATEAAKAQVAQIASLVGVPQNLLRAIQGLGS